MKRQIPSAKLQTNSNDQISEFQTGPFGSVNIGTCDLFGIWDLGFGIWNTRHKWKAKITPFSLILLIMLTLFTGGCGVKGPPVPWETIVPKRIVDLEAIPREERLLLEWTSPKENTDKSPLVDLAKFQVLRSEGTLIAGECRGCGEKPRVIHEMKIDGKEEARGKKISVLFQDLEARKVYVYQVVSVNRRGYPSSPSNPVTVYWDYPPQPPRMVGGERGDKRGDLHWEPVEGATGYNVYRKTEGEEAFPLNPLNRDPLKVTEYADLGVENEKKYIYSVRAVRRVVKTDVEGKGSLGVPVTPTDLIPPNAPTGLIAIPLKNGIELSWRRNREPDLLGYYVYRRKPGEKEFKKLNETPLEKEAYLDTQVELEQDYEYALTAVDHSPHRNESPLSEEVRVKYIY
ncbi:MAG: fibronectin type III domain-containing protein [Thermodesulfobacteriota bacterium]